MTLRNGLDFTAAIKRLKDDLLGPSGDAMEALKCRSRSFGGSMDQNHMQRGPGVNLKKCIMGLIEQTRIV